MILNLLRCQWVCVTKATLLAISVGIGCSASSAVPTESVRPSEPPGVSAASDAGSDNDEAPALGPTKDACESLANASCSREARCRDNAFRLDYASPEDCVKEKSAACRARLRAPGSSYRDTNARACAAALETASCEDVVLGKVPGACRPPPGRYPARAACADDAQCESTVCLFEDQFPCGTCSEKKAAGALQRCSSPAQCPEGEACHDGMDDRVMKNGVCRSIVGEGELCQNAFCAAGLWCQSGVCVRTRGEGQSCGLEGPCDPAKGLACDVLGTRKCFAPTAKFKRDEACDSTGLCEVGFYCTRLPRVGSVCVALPGKDEACTTLCAAPARCAGTGANRRCVIETPESCR